MPAARLLRPLIPPALYLLLYCALTWPLITTFNARIFCGPEDGYQNLWNLWWTRHALTELHQLPWRTTFLHWPDGAPLYAHTLAPLNGLFATLLQSLGLSLAQAYNAIVVTSFVLTGHCTYLLARHLTRPLHRRGAEDADKAGRNGAKNALPSNDPISRPDSDPAPPSSPRPLRLCGESPLSPSRTASLVAGAAFTFSHFHFAHAHNHLQLVPLQWMPLALLALLKLLDRPTIPRAIAAAGALFLVALTDFHLTFYTVLAGAILTAAALTPRLLPSRWKSNAKRSTANADPSPRSTSDVRCSTFDVQTPPLRQYLLPLTTFALLTLATTGLLAYQLYDLNRKDPLTHNHDPQVWSTDLIDPLVPAYQWRFHDLTKNLWRPLVPDPDDAGKEFVYLEHALYTGWPLTLCFAYALVTSLARAANRFRPLPDSALRTQHSALPPWLLIAALAFACSLGPALHTAGHVADPAPPWMPYALLERALPVLKMAGVPMRLMALTQLALAIIAALTLTPLLTPRPPFDVGRSMFDVRRSPARLLLIPLSAFWLIESLPRPPSTVPATYPKWVEALRALPPGPLIDTTYQHHLSLPLYYATGHGHPIGEGYLSRYPQSVDARRGQFRALADNWQFDALAAPPWNFRYLFIKLTDDAGHPYLDDQNHPLELPYPILYQEDPDRLRIYDLTQKR